MTNDLTIEQAVGELKAMKKHIEPYMSVVGVTAYDMAIKALEQQPSEDAIKKARKVIDEMTEIHSDGEFYIKNVDAKWIISKYLCGAEGRPKGRWIATENEEMNIDGYFCSCCDLPMETEERTKYCPNCGAEMMNGGEEDDIKA